LIHLALSKYQSPTHYIWIHLAISKYQSSTHNICQMYQNIMSGWLIFT
jgi:hypothetical protein